MASNGKRDTLMIRVFCRLIEVKSLQPASSTLLRRMRPWATAVGLLTVALLDLLGRLPGLASTALSLVGLAELVREWNPLRGVSSRRWACDGLAWGLAASMLGLPTFGLAAVTIVIALLVTLGLLVAFDSPSNRPTEVVRALAMVPAVQERTLLAGLAFGAAIRSFVAFASFGFVASFTSTMQDLTYAPLLAIVIVYSGRLVWSKIRHRRRTPRELRDALAAIDEIQGQAANGFVKASDHYLFPFLILATLLLLPTVFAQVALGLGAFVDPEAISVKAVAQPAARFWLSLTLVMFTLRGFLFTAFLVSCYRVTNGSGPPLSASRLLAVALLCLAAIAPFVDGPVDELARGPALEIGGFRTAWWEVGAEVFAAAATVASGGLWVSTVGEKRPRRDLGLAIALGLLIVLGAFIQLIGALYYEQDVAAGNTTRAGISFPEAIEIIARLASFAVAGSVVLSVARLLVRPGKSLPLGAMALGAMGCLAMGLCALWIAQRDFLMGAAMLALLPLMLALNAAHQGWETRPAETSPSGG